MNKTMMKSITVFVLLLIASIINITGLLGIGIIIALILPLLVYIFNKENSKYSLMLIPLVSASICQANKDYILLFISLIYIYLLRCVIKDNIWNKRKEWILSSVIVVGCFLVNHEYCVIPIMGLILTLPVVEIEVPEFLQKRKRIIVFLFLCVNIGGLLFCLGFDVKTSKKTAYLIHGNWANATAQYKVEDLRNEAVYSYSEFVDLLCADTILSLDKIDQYEELWIITPTNPFSQHEIETIEQWVKNGGNLILVSDHTDLYGHARCINQLARIFKYEVDYSVSMNYENNEFMTTTFGSTISIKGGNSTKSRGGFPLIANYLWTEPAYYANNNNFGPVVPSGNDDFGLRVTAETKPYGKGNVVMLCDSTVFANFCVYQPNIPKLLNLIRRYHPFGRLLKILPISLLLMLLLLYVGDKKWFLGFSILSLSLISYLRPINPLNWGKNPQIWTGESNYIYEGCPFANISTAYSLSRLSGRKPKWEDHVDSSKTDVIYVGEKPPFNKKWRWVKITDIHYEYDWKSDTSKFSPLYDVLKMAKVEKYNNTSFDSIQVANIYNDRVMNTWWYNDGISASRLQRIKSWISWLNKDSILYNPIAVTQTTDQKYECVFKIKNKESLKLYLPKPLEEEGEIYLGNGLSCSVYMHDGQKSLIGFGQKQENSNAEPVWVIDYK